MVDGVNLAVHELAAQHRARISTVQRLGTKVGILGLRDLPAWTEVQNVFSRALHRHNRSSVRLLENASSFRYRNPLQHKTAVSAYPWVAERIDEGALAAGVGKGQLLIVTLVMGLSTVPEWEALFEEEVMEFAVHLKRRATLIKLP